MTLRLDGHPRQLSSENEGDLRQQIWLSLAFAMTDRSCIAKARGVLDKLLDVWIALQVELHGQYSVDRFETLHRYSSKTSWVRVLALCVVTPLPCIALVILQDVVPLAQPRDGIYRNYVFWTRNWLAVVLMTVAILEQFRTCLPRLPMRTGPLLLVSAFATSVGVGWQFACSHFIGFPLPFGLVIGTCAWTPALVAACFVLWKRHIQQDSTLINALLQYLGVFFAQVSLTFTYPAYIFLFFMLGPAGQTAFLLVLVALKVTTKNWMSRCLKDIDDLKPEVIVFNVEVFNTLYMSCSLQTATAWASTLQYMAMDVVLAWLSFQDINFLLLQLDPLLAKMSRGSSRTFMELTGEFLRDPQVRSHPRLAHKAPRSLDSRRVRLYVPRKDSRPISRLMFMFRRVVHPTAVGPSIPAENDTHTNPHRIRPTVPPSTCGLTVDERVLFVETTLKLLFLLEFVVLIEFTEVIMPVIYAFYILAMSRLPNRQNYPRLAVLSDDEIMSTVLKVLSYAVLELISFLVIATLLNRKVRFSTFHHLAFVLDKHRAEVQSKLILWTFYIIQSMLFHFGKPHLHCSIRLSVDGVQLLT